MAGEWWVVGLPVFHHEHSTSNLALPHAGGRGMVTILSHSFHSSTHGFVLPPSTIRSGYPHAERESTSSCTVVILHCGFVWAILCRLGSSLFFLLSSIAS